MSNKTRRAHKKRRVTGSWKQLVAKSQARPDAVHCLKRWRWVEAAVLALALGLTVALLGGCGKEGPEMPAKPADRVGTMVKKQGIIDISSLADGEVRSSCLA